MTTTCTYLGKFVELDALQTAAMFGRRTATRRVHMNPAHDLGASRKK